MLQSILFENDCQYIYCTVMYANFLRIFFNFSYYISFVPFRFESSSENGLYKLRSIWYQKILCGTNHLLAVSGYALSLKHSVVGMEVGTPVTYFKLSESVFSLLYRLFLIKCLWRKDTVFLQIVNTRQQELRFDRTPNRTVESTGFLLTIFILSVVQATLRLHNPSTQPISHTPLRQNLLDDGLYDWYHGLVSEANSILYQNETFRDPQLTFQATEILKAGITASVLLSKYIMGSLSDMLLAMSVLTLWSPVKDFEELLESPKLLGSRKLLVEKCNALNEKSDSHERRDRKLVNNWKLSAISNDEEDLKSNMGNDVIARYDALRQLSNTLNQAIGELLIPFIGEGLFTYAINFDDILFPGSILQGIVIVSFYSLFLFILITASNICRKVHKTKEWLYENEKQLSLNCRQLTLLLESISRDSVGIALPGIFVINYSLVGTISSVLVTYFIIRLQYKMD